MIANICFCGRPLFLSQMCCVSAHRGRSGRDRTLPEVAAEPYVGLVLTSICPLGVVGVFQLSVALHLLVQLMFQCCSVTCVLTKRTYNYLVTYGAICYNLGARYISHRLITVRLYTADIVYCSFSK